jgi:hypothetical protein
MPSDPLDSRGTSRRAVEPSSRGTGTSPKATRPRTTPLLELAQTDYERQCLMGANGPAQQRIVEFLVRGRQDMQVRARERDRELRERHYFDTPEDAKRAKREAEVELGDLDRTESIFHSFVPLVARWRSLQRANATTKLRMAAFDLEADVGNRALMDVAIGGGAVSFLAEAVADLALGAMSAPAPPGREVFHVLPRSLRPLAGSFWKTAKGKTLANNKNAGAIGEAAAERLTGLTFREHGFRVGGRRRKTDFYEDAEGLIGQVKNNPSKQLRPGDIDQIEDTVAYARQRTKETGRTFSTFLVIAEGTPIPPRLAPLVSAGELNVFVQ